MDPLLLATLGPSMVRKMIMRIGPRNYTPLCGVISREKHLFRVFGEIVDDFYLFVVVFGFLA